MKMKAVICTKYGPPEVLRLEEVEKPAPKDNEILVRIRATAVTSGDVRIRSFNVPLLPWLPFRLALGLRGPRRKILGVDLAGEVEAAGKDVTPFKEGDRVFGAAGVGFGAYAEYKCLPEDAVLAPMPDGLSFEEAAAVFFGGHSALYFLRKGKVREGQEVAVYGASGAVGTSAVQLAKHFGAMVTGICSEANAELVKSLGAERVVDYTKEDFTQAGRTYDVIFDTVGRSPFSGCLRALKKGGVYLRAVHMTVGPVVRGLWTNLTSRKKVLGGVAPERREDLLFLRDLLEARKIRPVIDRTYPLERIVEAHRYVGQGHKKGSVVIAVG